LLGIGDAATLSGDYAEARKAFRDTYTVCLDRNDSMGAAAALTRLGKVHWRQEDLAAARRAFELALQLAGTSDTPQRALTLLQLADLLATSLGQNQLALELAGEALQIVERLDDKHLQSSACCVLGNIKARSNDLEGGRTWLERALALAEQVDDPSLGADACGYLSNLYAWTGDLERSREVSVLRANLARRTHDLFQLRHVYSWIGLCLLLQGKWADAEQSFEQEQEIVEALDTPEPRSDLLLSWAMLHFYTGRFGEAERELREAVGLLRPSAQATLIWHLGWLAQTHVMLRREREALTSLLELESLVDNLDERARARGNALAQLALGFLLLGDSDRAAACYQKLLPFQGQFSPVLIDRGLALSALAGGDVVSARTHFTEAESQARRARMGPELALILIQRAAIDRGSESEGLRLCNELGMSDLGQRMIELRHAARVRQPAGLSKRELDVLRLVAQGRTNREIAQLLVLSENTVARHLTSIFAKTCVENRAGARAFALRHGVA
jgi:DNA-binding CsgD family transcriptional regulator/tetratricopeptide (TPR) repeat protein